jgi:hypothetical protein
MGALSLEPEDGRGQSLSGRSSAKKRNAKTSATTTPRKTCPIDSLHSGVKDRKALSSQCT